MVGTGSVEKPVGSVLVLGQAQVVQFGPSTAQGSERTGGYFRNKQLQDHDGLPSQRLEHNVHWQRWVGELTLFRADWMLGEYGCWGVALEIVDQVHSQMEAGC